MQISEFNKSIMLLVCACLILAGSSDLLAQKRSKKGTDLAVIRGRIAYDKALVKSWDGNKLVLPYGEIKAKIREKVTPPAPPYPKGVEKWNREQLIKWETQFIETVAGKKFLEDRKQLIENAHAFDVKFEKNGSFVIYDVPAGVYGIQGRTDKKIGETNYGFEVFGEIHVVKGVEEIPLDPMRVEVTPMMTSGQDTPPVGVKDHDNSSVLNLKMDHFQDNYVFLNFWSSASPTAVAEQKMVQEMFKDLKDKHPIKLFSINVDKDRKQALTYIVSNKLVAGSHGFTDGVQHRTLFDFGVRSFPSFWLIGKDGKIKMSQYEVAQMMRIKPHLKVIIDDNIEGKGVPTLAEPPQEGAEDEKKDDDKTKDDDEKKKDDDAK